MSNQFEWQTDEDIAWEDLPEHEVNPGPPRRRRWPWLVLAALVLAVGAFIFYRANERAEANMQAMRRDIRSSHALVLQADLEQDGELFYSLLSGRDPAWTEAQDALFEGGLFLDRRPFGMTAQPVAAEASEAQEIEFDPDLLAAELMEARPYTVEVGNGLTETVTLVQISIYRLGTNRWLLSPADPEFWGESDTLRGDVLHLTYPGRDAELAERLHPDLERKLREMCRAFEAFECRTDDLRVNLTFSRSPETLLATREPVDVQQGSGNIFDLTLPAPTLVGLPEDDAAYAALFRGYAAQLVTAVTAQVVKYPCCDHAAFFEALMDYQLSQLDLRPWPVTAADYRRVLDERVDLSALGSLWLRRDVGHPYDDDTWQAYALVDFLLNTLPDADPAAMQLAFLTNRRLEGWLESILELAPEETAVFDLPRLWWLHAYGQAYDAADSLTSSPPDQHVQLLCAQIDWDIDAGTDSVRFFTYEPAQNLLAGQPNSLGGFAFQTTTSQDDGVLVQSYNFELRTWRAWQKQGDTLAPVTMNGRANLLNFGHLDPTGELLTTIAFGQEDGVPSLHLIALSTCSESGCTSYPVYGAPTWSPDGTRAVLSGDPQVQLTLLQLQDRVVAYDSAPPQLELILTSRAALTGHDSDSPADTLELGRGSAPFWLDETTFGFVSADTRTRIQLGSVDGGKLRTLLTDVDLQAVLPEPFADDQMYIRYALPHPQHPDTLFITAFAVRTSRSHVFAYDVESGALRWLMESDYTRNHALGLSPNGRYLLLTSLHDDAPNPTGVILLHDLTTGATVPFATPNALFVPLLYDWSADGNWMAFMSDEQTLALLAPDAEQPYLQLTGLSTDGSTCYAPTWVNPPAAGRES